LEKQIHLLCRFQHTKRRLSKKHPKNNPIFLFFKTKVPMNNIFKGLIAGYGASKLGSGCFGTVIVFIIIWVVLERCS
jgi:hypothetical protein